MEFTKKEIMFTEKEIKNMKLISSSKWIYFCLFFGALAFLFVSVYYYILSQNYAHLINKSMNEIFNALFEGFSPHKTYDGAYCAAIYNLITSIEKFFMALFFIFMSLILKQKINMYSKIVKLIENETK
jgi:hypothetical protein